MCNIEQSVALELGTGWYPIVPIALFLNGFEKTVSIDIQNWMTLESQLVTVQKFKAWRADGRLGGFIPQLNEERWNALMEMLENPPKTKEEFNAKINLETHLIDARSTSFADKSFDLICSNNTFEHIPENILSGILKEFVRLQKPSGVQSHFIDLSDHFAHFDHSITDYNFLQFSKKQWAIIDNSIQPQNRLRWPDYKKMYANLGIKIKAETTTPGNVDVVKNAKIHPEFAHFSPKELAITHGYLVS